jgi:hypothetical protein
MITASIAADVSRPDARTRRHRRHEYHVADFDRPPSAETLDALGARGWRLAGVVSYAGTITYHFIRPMRRTP